MKLKILVTGGAGFIGSRLCHFLIDQGHSVTAYDNLMLGQKRFLSSLEGHDKFKLITRDLTKDPQLAAAVKGHDVVFHLAANSDISSSNQRTDLDFTHGTVATYYLLEAMRVSGTKKIVFSSTSAVYGEAKQTPTPEDYGPLIPISLYGASKLACEGLVASFAHNYAFKSWIFRFANVVGPNPTHGAIFDFAARLKKDPKVLKVLGNGLQKKSYLHVDDCIAGMWYALAKVTEEVNLFNLASEGVTEVRTIAEEVVKQLGGTAKIEYGNEDRGWKGDVPFTWLDGKKLSSLGWKPVHSSSEAVKLAVSQALKAEA